VNGKIEDAADEEENENNTGVGKCMINMSLFGVRKPL
jgi:hypothetical protein